MTLATLKNPQRQGTPDPAEVITVTLGGRTFRAGRFTAAHLEWMIDRLAHDHPGARLYVLQSCYHTGYPPSAGTHDGDGVLDVVIYGLDWPTAQGWIRAHGGFGWWRHTGSWAAPSQWHIHYGVDGCPGPVGEFVPGQQNDYYARPPRDGLADHSTDPTWHPDDIAAQVFDYPDYLASKNKPPKEPDVALSDDDLAKISKIVSQQVNTATNQVTQQVLHAIGSDIDDSMVQNPDADADEPKQWSMGRLLWNLRGNVMQIKQRLTALEAKVK